VELYLEAWMPLALLVSRQYNRSDDMASTKQQVHGIIQTAATACDKIDGGSSSVSESDPTIFAPIQANMIIAIASAYGIEVTDAESTDLLETFSATIQSHPVLAGRQLLVGWLPGIDDIGEHSTAAGRAEAIGWAANSYFEKAEAK